MPTDLAQQLMDEFADNTGLTGKLLPRRYLWTDAFAVCNYFALQQRTQDDQYQKLAETLIRQVHHVLGRHRSDDPREGWISGLMADEGERHPTGGGLRIGKKLNERAAGEPYDRHEEWDRDGQYFHYLTKWMHSLYRAFLQTRHPQYLEWAVELALVAHRAFTVERPAGRSQRMVWKMSIDLKRPLVESMGHHDPLDGLVTALELQTRAESNDSLRSRLDKTILDFRHMCSRGRWATDDPLGIGGLLDSVIRIILLKPLDQPDNLALLDQLFQATAESLQHYARSPQLNLPAEYRLAFRELGLSIGLRGLELLATTARDIEPLCDPLQTLLRFLPLADQIESFWTDPQHRQNGNWHAHLDINSVMLATSLDVDGYFGITSPSARQAGS